MATIPDLFPARYWHSIENERIQCDLCPRHCKLKNGQHGFCFVRKNEGNQLVLTTYGRSSGFCIDPIEKKPLNHFFPGSSIFSFGTAGCNMGCQFCQNWDISKVKEMDRLQEFATPNKIAQKAKETNCDSVAFTYNEPIIFLEYAVDIAKECKKLGLKTVAVTSGYISDEARLEFFSVMDAANIDLKAFTNEFYKSLCLAELQPVLDTLLYLKNETKVWFEITTLLIPGENDSDKEINEMCDWILKNLGPDIPLHFTAFHPAYKLLNKPSTPPHTLFRARSIALAKGLKYVYTGNIMDLKGGSTYCPNCQELLIERNWYNLGEYNLTNNKCTNCNTTIAGRFHKKPGNWGRKRSAVFI